MSVLFKILMSWDRTSLYEQLSATISRQSYATRHRKFSQQAAQILWQIDGASSAILRGWVGHFEAKF